MPMGFNEFQRELSNRGIDGSIAIVLTMMWEQILELTKQGDDGAKIMLQMAESMQNVVGMHEHLKDGIDAMKQRLGEDDAIVQSVPFIRDDN